MPDPNHQSSTANSQNTGGRNSDDRSVTPYRTCLKTLGEDLAGREAIGGRDDRTENVEALFERQIELAMERARGKKSLGLMIHEYSDAMFNQMQTPWAEMLRDDDRFQLFVVITSSHLNPPEDGLDHAFAGLPWIWAPQSRQLARLSFIDAFIALDFAAAKMRSLPRQSLRFLQPHGTDIQACYSYMFYGAGLMFDHLLCSSFAEDIVSADMGQRVRNLFPPDLIDHGATTLTLVPFGSMKLDAFVRQCADAEPRDIIYNFSYWDLESATARSNAMRTVSRLLEAFPRTRLVFRPFPGDADHFAEMRDTFGDHSRFLFSTGPSYIEDYRNGAVLIYHRGSSAEIFSMATGQPSIRFTERPTPSPPVETETGFDVQQLEDLVALVGNILQQPRACARRLLQLRQTRYPTAGKSLEGFLDQLHDLLCHGRPHPAWRSLALHGDKPPSGRAGALAAIDKALGQGDLIPMLGTAAADAFPDEPRFQLYAAWSVMVHIYPSEITPHPWLMGVEYLAAFFRTAGEQWPDVAAAMGAEAWLAEALPPQMLGLWSHSVTRFGKDELQRLQNAIQTMPLDPFAPASIPRRLAQRLTADRDETRGQARLVWQLARRWEQQGDWQKALRLVEQVPAENPDDELLWCRLAYRGGNLQDAFRRGLDLLKRHHSRALVCLLLEILAGLEPNREMVRAAGTLVQKFPNDDDCMALAVSLARKWGRPQLNQLVARRLENDAKGEFAGWAELLLPRRDTSSGMHLA